MRQPLWKIWLSHLWPIHLESVASDYNEQLSVQLVKGRYQLLTPNAIYSFADLYTNFRDAFQRMALPQRQIEEVLLLGLGLGSVPYMLEKHFGQRYAYTAVECDEAVLTLADKYVMRHLRSPVSYVCADAYAFVMQTAQQFDLIAMDIFIDDEVPEAFESTLFLEALGDCLLPGGTLLYNRLAYTGRDKARSRAFFEEVFLHVFPTGECWEVGGNYILAWTNTESD